MHHKNSYRNKSLDRVSAPARDPCVLTPSAVQMAATASAPMTATHTILTFCTPGDSAASDCCRSSARCSASSSDAFSALLRVAECVGGGQEVEVSVAIPRSERQAAERAEGAYVGSRA